MALRWGQRATNRRVNNEGGYAFFEQSQAKIIANMGSARKVPLSSCSSFRRSRQGQRRMGCYLTGHTELSTGIEINKPKTRIIDHI
jgi:hypothetical protein